MFISNFVDIDVSDFVVFKLYMYWFTSEIYQPD